MFKYGSLIAVHSDPDTEDGTNFVPPTTAEALNDVLWYPSSYDPLTITGWSNVPYLAGGEISAGNTPEQVKQGLGDPCKLAGLSETQIRDMGIVDNGQWHMATPEEYNHIIAASNNEVSSYGYLSYHWLLFPHNRYRDESGASRGDGTTGCYWSNNASFFDFSGTPTVTANLRADKDRRNGYMVRCVRNEIPESYMRVGIIISLIIRERKAVKQLILVLIRIFLTGRLHLSLQERMWERQLPMISRLNPEMMPYIRHTAAIPKISLYMSNAKKVLHPVRLG